MTNAMTAWAGLGPEALGTDGWTHEWIYLDVKSEVCRVTLDKTGTYLASPILIGTRRTVSGETV